MDKDFAFLSFHCEYSSKGSTNIRDRAGVCFSPIFQGEGNGIIQDNSYTIKIYKLGKVLREKKLNNACLIDKKGIIHHLRVLKSIFSFKYRLKEHKDYFLLNLKLKADLIYHKYMLTWVRYLYEYPFNVFLLDANRAKKEPEFKFESIINLFNIIGATTKISDHGTTIHAIGETYRVKELLTIKEIKSRLKKLKRGHTRLNDIFKVIEDKAFDSISSEKSFKSSEYWLSENLFKKERLSVYKKNYTLIKSSL